MSLLRELSKIDDRTKFCVYGWIRNNQTRLCLQSIPSLIHAICILFFRQDDEFEIFDDKEIRLSMNKKCITKLNNGYKTYSYGRNQILSTDFYGKYRWDINIKDNDGITMIGISSTPNKYKLFMTMTGFNYFYFNSGRIGSQQDDLMDELMGTKIDGNSWTDAQYGVAYNSGDKVSVCLDLGTKELRFIVNDIDQGIAYHVRRHETIKYRLAIAIWRKNASVEIDNFKGL